MQPWALVSPASRGIGLAITRRLLETSNVPIVATARKDLGEVQENALKGLDGHGPGRQMEERLKVVKLDVLDEESIASAAEEVSKQLPKEDNYLHLAFTIPGILFPEKSPAQIDAANALRSFQVNALGPLLLIKHFSPFLAVRRHGSKAAPSSDSSPGGSSSSDPLEGLPKNSVWANMSARVGSISDNAAGGWYSYRSSKAAVNQITKSFDLYLRANGGGTGSNKSGGSAGEGESTATMCVSLHPGTVQTGLSKGFWSSTPREKLFSPEFAAEKLVNVVKGLEEGQRGRCWDWKGEEILP